MFASSPAANYLSFLIADGAIAAIKGKSGMDFTEQAHTNPARPCSRNADMASVAAEAIECTSGAA